MHDSVLRIGIGYDRVESTSWHTLVHSIMTRATRPVSIIPINLTNLKGIYTRQRDPKQSNEFSFTRFLMPYLCGFQGQSMFMDCDMLVRTDINELFELFDDQYAVQVVKHDYSPCDQTKYLGTVQYSYPKKNWSSVMLFNNEKCQALTPEYVNTATGLELHQFKWLEDEALIGDIPLEWNWLAGEYEPRKDVKNIHYTEGGPYFKDTVSTDDADEWFEYYREATEIDLT